MIVLSRVAQDLFGIWKGCLLYTSDMAEEMVTYSKNNILQQAGQSMLAQANQANQGVLSLLQ